MYSQFILVGLLLRPVFCAGISAGTGTASTVTIPVYLPTSSSHPQSSSIALSSTRSSTLVTSSILSSLFSTSNHPTTSTTSVVVTSIQMSLTSSITSVVSNSVGTSSSVSSTACPALVARDDDSNNDALFAASEFIDLHLILPFFVLALLLSL